MIHIKALREAEAKATKGDWKVVRNQTIYSIHVKFADPHVRSRMVASVPGYGQKDNAHFIALARNEMPRLPDWIDAVRKHIPAIVCELDEGAPTPRNLELAKLLAELEGE